MIKQCTKCLIHKSFSDFNNSKSHKDGLAYICRSCNTSYCKAKYDAIYQKDMKLQKTYKISLSEYNLLLINQNNLCAICRKSEVQIDKRINKYKNLSVDHDHKTGKVRGLLCVACNFALGSVKDDLEIINRMGEYIKSNSINKEVKA